MKFVTIRSKILFVILAVLLSSGITIISIWYHVSSETTDLYLKDISESTMRDAYHAFEYLLTDTSYMATMISINQNNIVIPVKNLNEKELMVNGQWNQQYLKNRRTIEKYLSDFVGYKYYIVGISIIVKKDNMFNSSHLMDGYDSIYDEIQMLDQEKLKKDIIMMNPIHVEGGKSTISSDYVVPAVRGITDSRQNLVGYTVLYFDYGVIEKMFSANLPEGSLFQVINGNDSLIYSNCGDVLLDAERPKRGYTYNTFDAEQVDWKFTMAIPSDYYVADIHRTALITGCFMIVIFVLAALILAVIISRMTTEITVLRNNMHEVAEGNLEVQYTIKSKDEIGQMGQTFNKMVVRIADLMQRVTKEEAAKRRAEMDFLQAQINPHFISNVLNNVAWMAKMQHADNVVPVINSLNTLLQKAMHCEKDMIELREELEYVDNYLKIMEYSGNYDFIVKKQIEPETENLFVPRFILQPILENAIYHGLPESLSKQGCIWIRTKKEEDTLKIFIEDNGEGMSQVQIEENIRGKRKERYGFNGIGIQNVNERIRLLFGENYGLIYESGEEGGTKAIFVLPVLQ